MNRRPFLLLCLVTGAFAGAADHAPTASILVEEAGQAADRGDHSSAVQALEQALQMNPGLESARFRLAAQKVFLREFGEAEVIFRELTQSANPEMAELARNSLDALEKERERVADYERRKAAFQIRSRAAQAEQRGREQAFRAKEADLRNRQEIYNRFAAGKDPEGLALLAAYAKTHPVPLELRFAAIYALQREGRFAEAETALAALPAATQASPEWLLAMGRTLRALGDNEEAWRDFSAADKAADGTPLAREAREEIRSLPNEADLDRWVWGELQLDAVYLARFSDTIFYGELREGAFIPGARWIQPYLQLDFTLDTKSGVEGLSEVYANNLAGGHFGVRIRPLANEAIWIYGLLGVQKDLRGTTRFEGGWFLDWRVGARAYKGFGPGLNFLEEGTLWGNRGFALQPRGRLAWFAEGGADGAYFSLYENFIAYYQLREGFRVLDVGSWMGLDLYALQQGGLDSRGLYYNNFFEFGGGLRAVTRLQRGLALITRLEGLSGAYLGRNSEDSRGTLNSTYADFRVNVSLWAEW